LEEKVEKAARTSHKERVAELNRKLEEMTEHYDIPKVTNSV
jgi:protein FAM32A